MAAGVVWLYGLASCVSLVYEVLWARRLTLVFGSSAQAVAAVLAVYLGATAAGALAARGLKLRPLATFSLLQAFAGLHSLAAPYIFAAAHRAYLALAPASPGPALAAVQLCLAAAAIGPPAAALGAGLPVLSGLFPRNSARVGLLLAAGTAAGAAGALAAGFLMLPFFGMNGAGVFAGQVSLGLAIWAWLAGYGSAREQAAEGPGGEGRGPGAQAGGPWQASEPGAGLRWDWLPDWTGVDLRVAAGAFAAGAAALALEVAWNRVLTLVLGGSTYGFSLMLAAFLAGLGYGGLWTCRRPLLPPMMRTGLAFILAGAACACVLSVWLAPKLPVLFLVAYRMCGGSEALLHLSRLLIAMAAFVPFAFFLGAVLPQCFWVLAGSYSVAPATVGWVVALNAAGCMAGAMAAAFLGIPGLGMQGTILAAAGLLWFTAAAIMASSSRSWAGAGKVLGTALAAAVVVKLAARPWDPSALTGGIYLTAPRVLESIAKPATGKLSAKRVLFYREGTMAAVRVAERLGLSPKALLSLSIDGKVEASTEKDMPTQALMAHLPLMLGPKGPRVFLVGLASGVTAGEALAHPVRSLTVAEIDPDVVEASAWFDGVNGRPLADPRTRLVVEDARQVLLRSMDRYGVIISQPSNPWLAGPAKLFTREFFELARARLEPGGVFGQWLQTYSLEPRHVRAVARTFQAVFPHAALFEPAPGDLILAGSASPLRLSRAALAESAAEAAAGLRRAGVRGAWGLAATWRLGEEALARFAGSGPVNTDDNGLLEFSAPLDLLKDTVEENRAAVLSSADDVLDRLEGWSGQDAAALASALSGAGLPGLARRAAVKALLKAPGPEAQAELCRSLKQLGLVGELRQAIESGRERWPLDPVLAVLHAEELLERGEARGALAVLGALGPAGLRALGPAHATVPVARAGQESFSAWPDPAWLRAKALWSLGRCREASAAFLSAAGPEDPDGLALASLHGPSCGFPAAARALPALERLRDRWAWLEAEEADRAAQELKSRAAFSGKDREAFQALLKAAAEEPQVRLRKALGMTALGLHGPAEEELSRLARMGGGFGLLAEYYRGMVLHLMRKPEQALPALRAFAARARLTRPADHRVLAALGYDGR